MRLTSFALLQINAKRRSRLRIGGSGSDGNRLSTAALISSSTLVARVSTRGTYERLDSVRPKIIDVVFHDACLVLLALLKNERNGRDEVCGLDAELLVA
jgi:hypothetical protein